MLTEKELQFIFYALSDEIRLKIIKLIIEHGELCVCNFMRYFNMSQPRISFHLRILKDANILKARKQGQWMYYSLNEDNDILKLLKDVIRESISIEEKRGIYCET